nr:ATP-binding cassette sub- A member 1 [Polyrhizophydium stewartii]
MWHVQPQPVLDGAAPAARPNTTTSLVNFERIMDTFADLNAARTGYRLKLETLSPSVSDKSRIDRTYDIVRVPSAEFIYNNTLVNPNITAWAVSFTEPDPATPLNVQYQVWYSDVLVNNGSDPFSRDLVAFVRGMDEAIITVLNDPSATVKANIDIAIKDWPGLPPTQVYDRIMQQLGPTFFFCSEMIVFINVLSNIMNEKELRLRHGLEVMGLRPSAYWISNFLSNSIVVIVNGAIMSVLGIAFNFPAMRNSNFVITFLSFVLFGEAMVLFAFLMTTFMRRTNTAILMGIFVFILGLLLQSFVFSDPQTGYMWWSNAYKEIGYMYVFPLVPFFNFGKIFLDITTVTTGRLDALTGTLQPGSTFDFNTLTHKLPTELVPQMGQTTPVDVPEPIQAWYMLIMNMAIFTVLTWYFDNVLPDEYGARKPPYFFVLPTYWGAEPANASEDAMREWLKANLSDDPDVAVEGDEDEDVMAARDRALDPNYFPALKIVNLRKIYGKSSVFDTGERNKMAVRNSCFTIEEGKLFALLGQNGAGKSTTISMLSGMTPATMGDALIYGLSAHNQTQRIRSIMGICPQHDILFNDLTAREHIELYAGIKGIPRDQIKQLIEERLLAVRLHTVADVRAGTYSGGMKRRLSLVISTIGDPKIIFMDEPTTGMDPVNRRCVWTFIEQFKQGRVIVLTTHSMEEADVLGDEIGVMSNGRLRAINNSIALKTKFGAGYHVSVVTDVAEVDHVKQIIHDMIPEALLEDASAGALLFQFPPSSISVVPRLVQWLEQNKDGLVRSWGISQSTLEEVFLKLVREANAKFSVRDEMEARMREKIYKKIN